MLAEPQEVQAMHFPNNHYTVSHVPQCSYHCHYLRLKQRYHPRLPQSGLVGVTLSDFVELSEYCPRHEAKIEKYP